MFAGAEYKSLFHDGSFIWQINDQSAYGQDNGSHNVLLYSIIVRCIKNQISNRIYVGRTGFLCISSWYVQENSMWAKNILSYISERGYPLSSRRSQPSCLILV